MTEDFILPDIGEGIVECELVEWLVHEGDVVEEDQPVADVQTDKALVQIPAKHAGRVTKHYVKEGEIAKVHAPLFCIELDADAPLDSPEAPPTDESKIAPAAVADVAPTQQNVATHEDSKRKVLATPAVRRLAREGNIDIASVNGTGPHGRVLKADMLAVLNQSPQPSAKATATATAPVANSIDNSAEIERIPMTGIRALMAKQMMTSVSTIPHFTYAEEIDITDLNILRRELNDAMAESGQRLTLMSLFIKTLSVALSEFPLVNSRMSADGSEIEQHRQHNIGMAVDSPSGLLVPNIKSVNGLSLMQVAQEVKRLTEAGRAGRLSPADMSGGTVTISNIGAIGGTVTTPIINAPEVAIVGIGRIQRLPRPDANDQLQVREIINVSWSGDHRVLDGGTIARFNNRWRALLEQPQQLLLSLR